MSLNLYLAFVAASLALALMPGPNVAVIISNSVAYGARYGLLTVAGTSSAMVPQLLVVTLGLAGVLEFMSHWFEVLRWIGVAYLLFLGVEALRAPAADLGAAKAEPKSTRAIYTKGLLVSLTNPKTLLFFGAFLPQFVDPKSNAIGQLALLSVTFLVLCAMVDTTWALAAGRARPLLVRAGRWTNRITGGVLITAAAALALARKP
jgi:threonine/homoserine/homoserine lactone efflux protein